MNLIIHKSKMTDLIKQKFLEEMDNESKKNVGLSFYKLCYFKELFKGIKINTLLFQANNVADMWIKTRLFLLENAKFDIYSEESICELLDDGICDPRDQVSDVLENFEANDTLWFEQLKFIS